MLKKVQGGKRRKERGRIGENCGKGGNRKMGRKDDRGAKRRRGEGGGRSAKETKEGKGRGLFESWNHTLISVMSELYCPRRAVCGELTGSKLGPG